jgi:hypothetical protein
MRLNTLVRARPIGVAAAAALALSLGISGRAAAAPTAAASVAHDTLTITGTNGPDQITIGLAADPNTLVVNFGSSGPPEQSFDRTTFSAIAVFLRGGDDQFSVTGPPFTDEFLTVDAGNGNDTITTGSANDLIDAGSGDDFVNGGLGRDTASLGAGRDTFLWNPGDGSDFVDGEAGTDTLIFNGAGASEPMSLSAIDHRAVFLRDPGQIRMDLDGVEQIDVNALGGADTVTINDMTGTDVRQANVDLGGSDTQPDTVTVNGTEQSDHARIEANSGSVDVEGLKTVTRITGAEPTDHLQVNSLDGNDKVTVDAAALPLIGVAVDLGPGQR